MLTRLTLFTLLTSLLASHPASASGKVLSWSDKGGASRLILSGWVVTDLVAFPRVETGFGKSWHVGPALREARIGADFQMARIWGGRLDVELSSLDTLRMDAWVEWRAWRFLRIRVGRFKIPFGRIQQLGVPEQPLLEVPLVTGNPRDFRDTGLMLHGALWNARVSYGLAVVTGSRDLAVDVNETPDLVGTLRLQPLRGLGPWVEGLGIGASISWGRGPLRRGFRGRTMGGWTFVNPPAIRGEQLRFGADLEWVTPRVTLRAEYQWQRQAREGLDEMQRVGVSMISVGNLEPWTIHGFHVDLAAHPWGKRNAQGPTTGIELVARFEALYFEDGSRLETHAEGMAEHAPLPDSWVQGVSCGLHGHVGWGVRLTALYQGLRFGRREHAPDFDATATPTQNPGQAGHWVHHIFLRAQWVY